MIQNVKINIVGVTFKNDDGTSRQDIIKKLDNNSIIFLEREPNNKYDKNAIKVCSLLGQIGYIGKDYAEIISKMIDNDNKIFSASISNIGKYKDIYNLSIIINENINE